MSSISIVISARNEEEKIERCLKSVSWADEIIFVDNESEDRTLSIAKKYTSTVYSRKNDLMLNRNKNFGFTKATKEWILYLDADEEIPHALAEEIKYVTRENRVKNTIDGYWINRKNICFGKWIEHGIWWPDKQLRLFRKGKGEFPCVHIHEYIKLEGTSGRLNAPFLHYNYETVSQYVRKLNTIYTENEVSNLEASGYSPTWFDAFRFPVSDFVKIYFAQGCYKDGLHGIVLSLLQSFYSFVVFAKMWERKGFFDAPVSLEAVSKELVKNSNDIAYWNLTARLKVAPTIFHAVYLRIIRKVTGLRMK